MMVPIKLDCLEVINNLAIDSFGLVKYYNTIKISYYLHIDNYYFYNNVTYKYKCVNVA